MLWAGGQGPVSLTDMAELLAGAGQSKCFSSNNREGDFEQGRGKSEM